MKIEIKEYKKYINDIEINDKIFNEEKSDYEFIEREEKINDLIDWIGEIERGSDKPLMKEDLKYLINMKDKYIFSSILTNKYILKSDNEERFNEICKEILKINGGLENEMW